MNPHRPLFWGIEHPWLFHVLAALALGIFLGGVAAKAVVWTRGTKGTGGPRTRRPLAALLVDGLAGRRIFRGDLAAGVMHALLLWGFLGLLAGTLLPAIDHYLVSFLHGGTYLVFSTLVDLSGILFVIGLLWALIRRYVQRVPRLERRGGDLLVALWLLAVALSGFLVEGLRLAIESPAWAGWSFAGLFVSGVAAGSATSPGAYSFVWWFHAALSLGLIAFIPFTRLFHVLAAPASIFLADEVGGAVPSDSDQAVPGLSFRQRVFLDACTHCGLCVDACPSHAVGEPLSPRQFVVSARVNGRTAEPVEPNGVWHCTTCGMCQDVCPVYAVPFEIVQAGRRQAMEDGTTVPGPIAEALEKLTKYGNPWEATRRKRNAWSQGLDVPDLTRAEPNGADGRLCYFVGCTTAMDTRAQAVARSLVEILKRAGVPFGTLGKKEPCCGDIARVLGEDGLFEDQREGSHELFERHGIHDVVTSSPHCFHTLRLGAPAGADARSADGMQAGIRSRHYVEVLDELVGEGTIRFEKPLGVKVTYHDPCYLGRHHGIYDAPRRILEAMPEVEVLEMPHHGRDALCCGGGGGRMWQEGLDEETKMSEVRIREAAETGAEVLVTTCPLCLVMLTDAGATSGLDDSLQVLDLNELVLRAIGSSCGDGDADVDGDADRPARGKQA